MALADLKVKISLEGVRQATQEINQFGDKLQQAGSHASGTFARGLASATAAIQRMGSLAIGATSAVAGLSAAFAFKQAAEYDSLSRGLASVSVNASDFAKQMERIKEVAKLPGLGLNEAIQGSVSLQSAGLSAREAERSMMAFGNALATVGRGKDDLNGVVMALEKSVSMGKVSAREIEEISLRVPQVRAAMIQAFGTADTEKLGSMGIGSRQFIAGVVAQLEKLPKITSGIKNDMENLGDAINQAVVPLGLGLAQMFGSLGGGIDKTIAKIKSMGEELGQVFAAVGKSGELSKALHTLFGDGIQTNGFQDIALTVAANVIAIIGNLRGAFEGVKYNLGEVVGYVSSLFNNLAAKAQGTFSLMLDGVKMFAEGVAFVFGRQIEMFKTFLQIFKYTAPATAKVLGGVLQYAGELTGQKPMFDMLKSISQQGWENYQKFLEGADIANPIKNPNFKGESFNLLNGADAIFANLKRAVGPLQLDGLNFGGQQRTAPQASSGIFAQWDKYLAGIEKNTAKTANLLDSRRVLGGGELARAGVSGAELARATDRRNARIYGRG